MNIMNRIDAQRSTFIALLMCGFLTSHEARAAKPTTADCLAASETSLKLGSQHLLRDERAQLLICSAQSCPGAIRRECTRRVEEVNAALPSIIFEVKDGQGQDLSAVSLSVDGTVLTERLDGSALTVDPGEHTFSFEAPGQPALEKHFVIREGQKDRHEAITFAPPAAPAASIPPAPASQTAGVGDAIASPPSGETSHGLGAQKAVALVVGGVGVAGVVVGSVFGLKSKSKHDQAADLQCGGDTCHDPIGYAASRDAIKAGNISTIGFIVGAVGLAGGAVLWLTAKKPESSETQVGLGPGSIQVRGSW